MPVTKYGAETTAAEVVDKVDLRGRRVVVTGASSGIGVETARAVRTSKASPAAITKTVQRRHPSVNAARTLEALPLMHLTSTTPSGSGRSPMN
jgi:hypothetical protein